MASSRFNPSRLGTVTRSAVVPPKINRPIPKAPRTATATAERLMIQKIVLRPARPRRRREVS